ncbi:3-isopropylmalate dehydrogenase [Veillonella montpellierensis]|uniref:3-isopropylmalate dehydrogenase n=1 Tax=Veillonella montpellierensis TaxID=187328 RepID=UPI0023F7E871|nr:3-isopropylmalate dehydrogenase [Veillonella montpellierensis]
MTKETRQIVLIPGDGIGAEIIDVTRGVCDVAFAKANIEVEWIVKEAGGASIDACGVPLTEDTITACKKADAVLLGAVGGPKWDHVDPAIRPEKAILGLRKALGLFCNLRPVKIFPALREQSPLKQELVEDVDFMIVRELTGGIYFGERSEASGTGAGEVAWDKETYSRMEIERIMDVAIDMARKRHSKVASVDKANVLASSRLWRRIAQEKAAQAKDVTFDYLYVDNAAQQIVVNPGQFDVMVTTNLFGDILSDEGAVVSGSIGLLPSASIGTGTPLFEPIHGSAPDIMGKDIANPLGTILAAAMMCRYALDCPNVADSIEHAVSRALTDGYRTRDIARGDDRPVKCHAMAQAVIERLDG